VRYARLARQFPDRAQELFQQAEDDVRRRYQLYKRPGRSKAKGNRLPEAAPAGGPALFLSK